MKLEHVAINVPDAKATAQWYVEHLGMHVVRSVDQAPYMHFLADEAGSMIELYTNTTAAQVPDYTAVNPYNLHLAFFVDGDLAAKVDELVAAGATSLDEISTTPAGDQLTFLRDPWGVPIQLLKRRQPMTG